METKELIRDVLQEYDLGHIGAVERNRRILILFDVDEKLSPELKSKVNVCLTKNNIILESLNKIFEQEGKFISIQLTKVQIKENEELLDSNFK